MSKNFSFRTLLDMRGGTRLRAFLKESLVPRSADVLRIRSSGEFDSNYYASQLREPLAEDPIDHYVRRGEAAGLRPTKEFDPVKYRRNSPDLVTFRRNLFAHYLAFGRSEGRELGDELPGPVPAAAASRATPHERLIDFIQESGYFDPAYYAEHSGIASGGKELVLHYLDVGEQRGHKPSARFDPDFYRTVYPDVAKSGMSLLEHYARHGAAEGRKGQPIGATLDIEWTAFDASLPLVVVLLHEASRTGAPILGWNIAGEIRRRGGYNVLTLSKRGGVIEQALKDNSDCAVVFPKGYVPNEADGFALGQRIAGRFPAVMVIANSVETRELAVGLRCAGHALVALIHEFAAYSKPRGSLRRLYEVADELIFPADIVRGSSVAEYPFLTRRTTRVLAQGPSAVPGSGKDETEPTAVPDPDFFTVIGMGFVDWRKGCDVFIAVAAALRKLAPHLRFKFIWYGGGFEEADHIGTALYLKEQVARSDLSQIVEFRPPVANIEALYGAADVLLMSSRLDPLPNVTIDAALRGLPVVCFDRASGMAELFQHDIELRRLVAPYLDAESAAVILHTLATDAGLTSALRAKLKSWAERKFIMADYVGKLLDWGLAHSKQARDSQSRVARLERQCAAKGNVHASRRALAYHVVSAEHLDQGELPLPGYYGRRLWPGFNPFRYAAEAGPGTDARRLPLLDYLERDCPEGPWRQHVIGTQNRPKRPEQRGGGPVLKVVLHVHVHYTDLLTEFRTYLARLPEDVHLVVTTDAQSKLDHIEKSLAGLTHRKSFHAWSNLGRDVRPFLNVYKTYGRSFDVIGHLHTKKSLAVDSTQTFGDQWRTFLLEGLIGANGQMARQIFRALTDDQKLGLVFPEDPNLIGWEKNLSGAIDLLARMGLKDIPLPNAIDFPVGTMFWARTGALEALYDLALAPMDYPEEPLPYDGTLLHAFERLLPLLAQQAGFHCGVTNSGVKRE